MSSCQVCGKYVPQSEGVTTLNGLLVCNKDTCRTLNEESQAVEKIDSEAHLKAIIIYNLLNKLCDVREHGKVYWPDGTLDFGFRSKTVLDCRITPVNENNYSMKIFKVHNLCESTVLKRLDNIKASELYNTFIDAVRFLDTEYVKLNLRSWSEYEGGIPIRGAIR